MATTPKPPKPAVKKPAVKKPALKAADEEPTAARLRRKPRGAHGLTREAVYQFVRQLLIEGRPPTVREVQFNFSFKAIESARTHLENLVRDGRLIKDGGARGYRLPLNERPRIARQVPLLGRVQAGALTTAIEHLEGLLPVDGRPDSEELFALRVRGESMIGAGILPNDIVIVRKQERAEVNEIIVALIGDEATVKRYKVRRGRIELHAENPAFSPIVPPEGGLRILGKVIEVRRYLDGQPLR